MGPYIMYIMYILCILSLWEDIIMYIMYIMYILCKPGRNDNEGVLPILQSARTGASPSDLV